MHLPVLHRRPFPVADRDRNGAPYRIMHPRLAAIDLIRGKIADRKAGLDPYDPSIFILVARTDEKIWANRCLELVGHVLSTSRDTADGGRRFRAVIEADVRLELGLDGTRPPILDDEPLASRGISTHMEAILDIVHPTQPRLELVPEPADEPVPIHKAALERARHLAALRVDCGCGAAAGVECDCEDVDRLASAVAAKGQVH